VAAFAIRLALVYVAKLVDESPAPKKYTDVDYDVFTDAAQHVAHGSSPYARHTYRYTPLAAYICLVNIYIHPLAGKVVFCALDVLMGMLMWSLIESQNQRKNYTFAYVASWLYNPVTIMMSTRGSNDNIIALLVYATLYYLLRKDYTKAGLLYGLSVHFKIYPIIYSFVFYLFIDCDKASFTSGSHSLLRTLTSGFFTSNRWKFTLISASTFLALTAVFYFIYGYEFLYEAYLYHLIRKDNRHNYSAYFYLIYQTYDMESSALLAVLTFVPQWTVVVVAGLLFYYDVFFAMLLQTWAFVTFNKVCTE